MLQNLLNRLSALVLTRPRQLILGFLIAVIAGFWSLKDFSIDNSLGVLYDHNNEQEAFNTQLRKDFGNLDEIVVLAYHHPELFSQKQLEFLKRIQNDIEAIPGIEASYSLANVPVFLTTEEDGERVTKVRPFLENIPDNPAQLADLKQRALDSPLYNKVLLSPDGKTAGFNILFSGTLSSQEKEDVIRKIRSLIQTHSGDGRFFLTGMHAFMEASGRFMTEDILRFSAVLVVNMLIILLLLYRNLPIAFSILISAGICVLLTVEVIASLGMSLSIATTPVPALVMALCTSYCVHVFNTSKSHLAETITSNFYAAMTSFFGFSSMAFNPVQTVRELGIYLSIGTVVAYITSIFFAGTLKFSYFPDTLPLGRFEQFSLRLFSLVKRRRWAIYIPTALLFLSGIFMFRMELDTNYYKYYLSKSDLTESVDFVNNHLSGQYPYVIQLTSDTTLLKPDVLRGIVELTDFLGKQPMIDKVLSIRDIFSEAYKTVNGNLPPDWYGNGAALQDLALLGRAGDKRLVSYYLTPDNKKSLIVVRTSAISSKDFKQLLERTKTHLQEHQIAGVRTAVGGTYVNIVESADDMAVSQLSSAFSAILLVLVVIQLGFRDRRATAIAVIVNVLPIMGIYGIISLMGETLNMGTTTIAAITFGMSVDDTIHFLSRYRYAKRQYALSKEEAVAWVFKSGVPSMICTSLTISAGFLALTLSAFKPIFQLGLYTAISMLLCLTAVVFLLPRILLDFYREAKA